MNAQPSQTLHCPKCRAAVRARAEHAGKRLKCPKCGGVIKVPGALAVAGDDEQWFSLEEPSLKEDASAETANAEALPRAEPIVGDASETSPADPPSRSRGDQAEAAAAENASTDDWLSDLPPMEDSGDDSSAPSAGSIGDFSDSDLAALQSYGGWEDEDSDLSDAKGAGPGVGPGSPVAAGPPRNGEPPATDPEALRELDEATEYRAKCPVCESMHYVTKRQAGTTIRCDDCYTNFQVPPPPKVKPKTKVRRDDGPSFRLAEVDAKKKSEVAPGSKSAEEYLRAAEDEVLEDTDPHADYETPDLVLWLRETFGIFRDPSVVMYWLVIALIGALPGAVLLMLDSAIVLILFNIVALVYGAMTLVTAFAILEAVANGESRVDEWPTFDVTEWIDQFFLVAVAFVLSSAPGFLLGSLLFGGGLMALAMTMFSQFLFFPYVLLSILDNGSVLMPISSDVTKSVTRCFESWGALYFSAGLLFFGQFVIYVTLALMASQAVMIFVDAFLTVGFVYLYFAMIGRLAYRIGQSVNSQVDRD